MPFIKTDAGITPGLLGQAKRFRQLADDLEAIASGRSPDPAVLEAAPVVDTYSLARCPVVVLAGSVRGHPTLRKPFGCTSEVVILAEQEGWARTMSRFYRLGRAADPESGGQSPAAGHRMN